MDDDDSTVRSWEAAICSIARARFQDARTPSMEIVDCSASCQRQPTVQFGAQCVFPTTESTVDITKLFSFFSLSMSMISIRPNDTGRASAHESADFFVIDTYLIGDRTRTEYANGKEESETGRD